MVNILRHPGSYTVIRRKRKSEICSLTIIIAGWLGTYLRTLNITALVNGTLFLHGGLHPKWALPSVDTLNAEARKHLLTKTPAELWNVPLFGGDGPLWYRGYAMDAEDTVCSVLDKVLNILQVGLKDVLFEMPDVSFVIDPSYRRTEW